MEYVRKSMNYYNVSINAFVIMTDAKLSWRYRVWFFRGFSVFVVKEALGPGYLILLKPFSASIGYVTLFPIL